MKLYADYPVSAASGLLEMRRWAGEIILKAIAVPGLFLLMCRLYCTATRAPLVYVEVEGLRRRLPQRVGARGVHAGEGVCGVCAEEGAGGSAPCWYMLRPLWRVGAASGLGLCRRLSPGSSIIAACFEWSLRLPRLFATAVCTVGGPWGLGLLAASLGTRLGVSWRMAAGGFICLGAWAIGLVFGVSLRSVGLGLPWLFL